MKQSRIATAIDLQPAGMRCPYCAVEINVGDEFVDVLDGMVEDTPLVISGICPSCAERLDEVEPCDSCPGTGTVLDVNREEVQCPRCGGMGEFLRPADSSSTEGESG